jgi:hypothetical protein
VTTLTTLPTEDEVRSADPWRYELLLFPELDPITATAPTDLWDILVGEGWNVTYSANSLGRYAFAVKADEVVQVWVDESTTPTDAMVKVAMVARLRDLTRVRQ